MIAILDNNAFFIEISIICLFVRQILEISTK